MEAQQQNKNEVPEWLQFAFLIGGAILIGYLLQALLEYLFPGKPQKFKKGGGSIPRVFISHSWDKDEHYKTLIKRFDYYGFDFYNHSIPEDRALDEHDTKGIEEGIRNKIRGCATILVLAGPYADSYWIKKEVAIAKELEKEIIAIRPYGATSVPSYLKRNADKIIGFNAKSIIEIIKEN